MTPRNDTALDDKALDQAVAWLVRVESDTATGEDWSALTLWLEASPDHLAAFEVVEMRAAEVTDQSAEIVAGLSKPSREPAVFPRRPPRPAQSGRQRYGWAARRAAIAAGFTVLCVSAGFGLWQASEGPLQVYRTGVGETRAITLADGSHIRLDAASTMEVRLGWFTRKVRMGDSEATFDVAKNPNRPFVIAVGDQRVRVVGTEFNINSYGGDVDVTVRRGVVAVYQKALGDRPIAELTRGWSLKHTVGENVSFRSRVNPDAAFAWTEGRLICDDEPLSQIVAYLNRRYAEPIRLPASAEGRRFTGVIELDDQRDVARRLASFLSLSVHGSQREIVLD